MVLKLFSEPGCNGTSKVLKDSEVNLAKAGVNFQIQSAIVDGNPWILFSEERYQGFLAYLEEGRYEDFSSLSLPQDKKVCSVKYKKESLGNPQIILFNSATLPDGAKWACLGDSLKLKSFAVGRAGVWGVKQDFTVMYKEGTGHGQNGIGNGWTNIMGKMRQITVGDKVAWGVNTADEVFVRVGLSSEDPKGKEWSKIEGSMKTISVGGNGICWAVDKKDTVWRRLGAKDNNPIGTKWQSVTGRLTHISVGGAGVWGISPKNEVMCRDQTFGLTGDGEGSGWSKVDGFMVHLTSGENAVWGVSANGDMWCRAGIDQTNPMGNNWFKVTTNPEKNIEWKMVAGFGEYLFGIDKDDLLQSRENSSAASLISGNEVSLFDENGNFKSFNIQEKPSSYIVRNGGWVVYSSPNYKGKTMYHFDGDCYSNDPPNPKGPKLKSWHDPIGSIRPMRGLDCRALSARVSLDWDSLTAEHQMEVVETFQAKNTSFDYQAADWKKIATFRAVVKHNFQIEEDVPGCTGATFSIENVPKAGIPFTKSGNILETGTDFRQELSALMTFQNESVATRERSRAEMVRFPPFLQPKTDTKVEVVVHKGLIRMPFKVEFSAGNSQWTVCGEYTGEDATQIKLQFTEKSLLEGNRKVSRL